MRGKLTLSPSYVIPAILTTDKQEFAKQLEFANSVGCVHIDVINNDFCEGASLEINEWPQIEADYSEVHLMVNDPSQYIEQLSLKGIRRAIVHLESNFDLIELRNLARMHDVLLGYAVNPDTDLFNYKNYFEPNSYILVMGVNPGKSGQSQLPQTESAVHYIKRSCASKINVCVDGGVNLENITTLKRNDVDFVSASSAIFSKADYKNAYAQLIEVVNG